jgi:ABC-type transport system substrate-binding protein
MAVSRDPLRTRFGICIATILLASACASVPPSPAAVLIPSPVASAPPTQPTASVASPGLADTIRIALPAGGEGNAPFGPLTNATSSVGDDYEKAAVIDVFIHDALYRYDEQLKPVPSLASSCDPSGDGLTITCHLVNAMFQSGDPVTAEDVVFTYQLMAANTHVESDFAPRDCVTDVSGCLSDVLDSVVKVDERTVAFHLRREYTPFFTIVLPSIWIDSESSIRASYDRLHAKLVTVSAADLTGEAGVLASEVEAPAGNCVPLLDAATQLVARAGLFVPARAEYQYLSGGELDACSYAASLSLELAQGAASLGAQGLTAIALLYPDLDIDRNPVGAGPYKVKDYVANQRLELEAWSGYHGGVAATPKVVFQIYPDDTATANAVAHGQAHWLEDFYDAAAFRQLSDVPSLRFGHPANPFYAAMVYNVRPGQLFADLRLRQAVELCVNKPAAVAAATEGRGVPAYADVAPGTWAYDAKLPRPERDVQAARQLIESAGWTAGADGIYQKSGQPLAATIYVRTDATDRIKLAQLIRSEVRDCGMDLMPSQSAFDGGLRGIIQWPNFAPDTSKPFDLYLVIEGGGWDPLSHIFDPSAITTEAAPKGDNFGGFSDPRITDLLTRTQSTYDVNARADLYRQYQQVLAEQQPALFLWHQTRLDAAANGLRTIDGPLDLDLPHWFAFPERLVVEASGGS